MVNWLNLIKSVALALAIIIVFNLFIGMGIRTFYPAPETQRACNEPRAYQSKEMCEEAGGVWVESPEVRLPDAVLAPRPAAGSCDLSVCYEQAREAAQPYRRNVFIVWVVAGIAAILVGMNIAAAPAVAAGLSFGGVVSFVVGTAGYWADMDEYLRFIILAIVLAALIGIGYRRVRPRIG